MPQVISEEGVGFGKVTGKKWKLVSVIIATNTSHGINIEINAVYLFSAVFRH